MILPKLITLSRFFAESAKAVPWGRIYPRRFADDGVDPLLASAEKLDRDDTVEKVRSGEGHEEMAGVGESDGGGE